MSAALSDDSMTKIPSCSEGSYSAFRGMVFGFALCSPVWIGFGLLMHSVI